MHNDRLTSLKQLFVNKENSFVKNLIMSDEEEPINKKRLTAFSSRWLEMPNFASWLNKKKMSTLLCANSAWLIFQLNMKASEDWRNQPNFWKREQIYVKRNTEEILIAKAELLTIFHNIKHGLSYNSLDCHSKLEKCIFPDSKIAAKITCGRTKSSAIARNVLEPFAEEQVVLDLKKCYYFAIGNDAASIGNVKYFAYTVQYFDSKSGICKKILDFYEDDNSKYIDIYNTIKQINDNFHLSIDICIQCR